VSTPAIERLNAALAGRYLIERELGEGGMATVYLADDIKHERKVALKVLKPELAAVVGAERFLAEIKTTANLQHPHILPLFDSGEADSFLFYVMPYVEGETLRERIDRERQLPVDEALGIATAVAGALHVAHEQGVVHRDIKPGNILMSRGQPLVADFGIALAVSAGGGGRLTETGLSLGTPYYMSPEQATGDQAVGPASDTFALACVLYEMLVGEPPYPGSTAQAVLGKIIQGLPVSATAIRQSVPANVDAAIGKALEKLPADRFTSAQSFARALADPSFRHGVSDEAGVGAGIAAGAGNRLSLILAALLLFTGSTLAWSLRRPDAQLPVARYAVALPADQAMGLGTGGGIALSPDGRWFVYVGTTGDSRTQLLLRRRDQLTATPLPGTEGAAHPTVSPDGSKIAYTTGSLNHQRRLMVVSVNGGPPLLVEDSLVDGNAAWGPDGYIYYDGFLEGDGIARVREGGGTPEPVTMPRSRGDSWHDDPHPLPNGKGILFSARRDDASGGFDVAVADLETGGYEILVPGGRAPIYSRTGHLVYVSEEGSLVAVPFDEDRLALTGDAVALAGGVTTGGPRLTLADDGTLLYVAGEGGGAGERQLDIVDALGNTERMTLAPRPLRYLTWSPDGETVAFVSSGQVFLFN
jgi:serine/threonine-protein kinase